MDFPFGHLAYYRLESLLEFGATARLFSAMPKVGKKF